MPDEHTFHTEPDRIHAVPVLAIVFGFLAFAALCVAGLLAYYNALVGPGLYVPPKQFPQPALQSEPLTDAEKLQNAQRARIERYGWIDQSKGLVRIPIQRAMQIVAAKGPSALEPLAQPPSPAQNAAEAAAEAMTAFGGRR
jgi:hypothetical protein